MEVQAALTVMEYMSLLSRFQTLQILGFVLAGTAVVILVGATGLSRISLRGRILFYTSLLLILTSVVIGLFTDIHSIRSSTFLRADLNELHAISPELMYTYFIQIALAVFALMFASWLRKMANERN